MPDRGRPRLPLGTYGEISVREAPNSTKRRPVYIAKARFRDTDGATRSVTRRGATKERAKNELRAALAVRADRVQAATITNQTTITDLAATWLAQGDWATNTVERYKLAAGQITARLGAVRVQELSRAGINTAIRSIQAEHGPGSAKSAKSALAGMCKLAMLYDALESNPVRDTIGITSGVRKKEPRALTVAETEDLCDRMRSDPEAVHRYDLPDLVEFMLGTGCRIGEACAARSKVIDLAAGVWEINATVVRVKGQGLTIQERPKTAAGWRILALPSYVVAMIRRRNVELTLSSGGPVIFGSPHSKSLRDPSNTAADLRLMLDRLGYPWLTSHGFRKTVATRLDDAGMSARQIADQLGHASPSLTLDVYVGRKVVSADAARILDR